MRRRSCVWRGGGGHVQDLARLGAHLCGIHEPVAAHPDLIIGHRKIGDQITSLIVRHDDAGEFGGQVRGLGDHPYASFRPIGAAHHAADVVIVNGDDRGGLGEGLDAGERRGHTKSGCRRAQKESGFQSHAFLPMIDSQAEFCVILSWRPFRVNRPLETQVVFIASPAGSTAPLTKVGVGASPSGLLDPWSGSKDEA